MAFEAVNLSGFRRAYCIMARAIDRSTKRPYRYVQTYLQAEINFFLAKRVESIDTLEKITLAMVWLQPETRKDTNVPNFA